MLQEYSGSRQGRRFASEALAAVVAETIDKHMLYRRMFFYKAYVLDYFDLQFACSGTSSTEFIAHLVNNAVN